MGRVLFPVFELALETILNRLGLNLDIKSIRCFGNLNLLTILMNVCTSFSLSAVTHMRCRSSFLQHWHPAGANPDSDKTSSPSQSANSAWRKEEENDLPSSPCRSRPSRLVSFIKIATSTNTRYLASGNWAETNEQAQHQDFRMVFDTFSTICNNYFNHYYVQ